MPPISRSGGRNVHIYDANDTKDPPNVLGGLKLTNGVTNANLYSMVEILVIFSGSFSLRKDSTEIENNHNPLQPGKYYIVSTTPFVLNNEQPLLRSISLQTGSRLQAFCSAVRARDRRCVVSGQEAKEANENIWWGFEAAHIFPLAYEGHWNAHNYGRWISCEPKTESINSVQNGLLLRSDLHQLFDSYAFSINPDDNHKIIFFANHDSSIAGRHLDQKFLDDPQRPVDELLRWHFKQAVFTNMKSAGEPVFEHDFPPGSDIVGSILGGPKSTERMEFELFGRLAAQVEIDYS